MNTWGSRYIDPHILDLEVCGQIHVPAIVAPEKKPVLSKIEKFVTMVISTNIMFLDIIHRQRSRYRG
jgi:hypothetical protein